MSNSGWASDGMPITKHGTSATGPVSFFLRCSGTAHHWDQFDETWVRPSPWEMTLEVSPERPEVKEYSGDGRVADVFPGVRYTEEYGIKTENESPLVSDRQIVLASQSDGIGKTVTIINRSDGSFSGSFEGKGLRAKWSGSCSRVESIPKASNKF